ncbi:MAG: hypothetical protein Q8O16_06760 [Dehalococcoidia bacterium]|nr:hypothetical protein [Dehalococcoidia bacterium]
MRKSNKIPEFRTLEEEREYWEARGPLAEGHRGRIHISKTNQKSAKTKKGGKSAGRR